MSNKIREGCRKCNTKADIKVTQLRLHSMEREWVREVFLTKNKFIPQITLVYIFYSHSMAARAGTL